MADPSTCHRADDSLLIPHLPDDLSVQCIARVPRSSHPSVVLVSRSWCSLLRSRRLFALRAQLGVTEPSLCVNICTPSGESRWYFLNLRPCRLLPLPPPPFPTFGVGCAVVGSSLYVLGGYHGYSYYHQRPSIPSSAVQIFDPCLNRWTTAPSMAEARRDPVVSEFNGRIYVFGGCVSPSEFWYDDYDPESGAWAEVFDPATGAWASLPRRPSHLRKGTVDRARRPSQGTVDRAAVFRGQLLMDNGLLLDPEAVQPWGTVPKALMNAWAGQAVVLDGVLYAYNFNAMIGGYDQAAGVWKTVEGVGWEVPEFLQCSQLTTLGGMLCLIWIPGTPWFLPQKNMQSEIHCVGVQITRTSSGGFRGSVAWRGVVANTISSGSVMNSVVLEF